MKKQDLFDLAKYEYQSYLYTNNKCFKESASNYYKQYKQLNGKKIISGLEC